MKLAARELGIATLEPERLREIAETLRGRAPDLFAVASYGKIVPQPILDIPALGALNVHPSLLPLYRGATPLQAQLRDGVALGGVSIILMDAGMDTGDIVVQRESPIGPRETYGELHERFAELGAALLSQAVAGAASGTLVRVPQAGLRDEAEVARTATRPLAKGDYVLAAVHHSARMGGNYQSGDAQAMTYHNSFTCLPASVPFRPHRVTPKPVIQGTQTAVVVGPKGEELYTDKYGRVKVQFHWDREGKGDEKSSCWVRVAQMAAGKRWGSSFWPAPRSLRPASPPRRFACWCTCRAGNRPARRSAPR